jgi:hypothetical protein
MKTDNGSHGEQSSGSRSEAKLSARTYGELQRQLHKDLLAQHPEWIDADGNCLPATTTSVDSLGSSRFSNPKAKNRSKRSEMKPRKLNGKVVQCLPNQTERRLLCNHIKLTTSLRITT